MKRNRSVCLIGGLTALLLVAVVLLYPALRGPRTEGARVRAVLHDMIAAVLDEDFEEEWSFYSTSAQEHWSEELAKWRVLEADSNRWGKLFAFHALTRADVLEMDAEMFFIAIRRSNAYADPEEWAASQDLLRSLGPGEFKLRKNGSASISFDNDRGPEVDIHTTAFEFVMEDGDWKFAQVFDIRSKFGVLPQYVWDEPVLELAAAVGAGRLTSDEIGFVLNLIDDGSAVARGGPIELSAVADLVASPGETGTLAVFRCDARVPWSVASEWLGALVSAGANPVALAVAPPPEDGGTGFLTPTPDGRLDLHPSEAEVRPADIDAVIEVGPHQMTDRERMQLMVGLSDIKSGNRRPVVLLNSSPDASWGSIVRVLAAIDGAAEQVYLSTPGEAAFEGGVRLVNGKPADLKVMGPGK